ncbi:MAG TPA: acyl-CoA carboxylase subunit beta, partial [Burkholderiaceae bacterium]
MTAGMPALSSAVNAKAEAFKHNANRMHEKLAEVRALEALVVAESESKRARFEERGQLLPRERVARLIDRGSTFLELSTLAGLGMHDDDGKKT